MFFKENCCTVSFRRLFSFVILLILVSPVFGLQISTDDPQPFPDMLSVRGTGVNPLGSDAIIQTEEGQTFTVHTSDNTRIYKKRQPVKISDVQAGDMLVAAGELDANSHLMRALLSPISMQRQ